MDLNDHRTLGRRLGLFDTASDVGAGLPIWLPDGAILREQLEGFAAEIAERSGCQRVYTPVLAKRSLFERSGHWEKFSADMFPPMRVGGDELVLRPANCPSHVEVYRAAAHSWRDLPLRLSESASMFRSELTGVLGGLSRVRQISLDDAHVFCRPDQVVDEVVHALKAIRIAYDVLGIDIASVRLSVRGTAGAEAGDDDTWAASEQDLSGALERLGLRAHRAPGEGAFYGPKIDVQIRDAAGREQTLSTVQVDRVLPQRFALRYAAADGSIARPVMVHRGLIGSMERLVAVLIEQYQGRFPTWLAPVQIALLPLDPRRHADDVSRIQRRFADAGIRARLEDRGSLGARIRRVRDARIARVAVIGDRELAEDTVSIDDRAVPVEALIARIQDEIRTRAREPRTALEDRRS
ncbi:threonyl-tRNA synthetase [Microbacterium resistens]|uniref:Threonine--tRNA ligase n=1 Tax=Microbacterium resistens TaxID=156977 RepID=A0ABU1SDZ2_9MICO|nr:threonine--tRNA ligase [Microbacterium resistens]MDR6867830.1 threonyl-tRNA synthetase [Microbacterium resistens]